MRRTVPIVLTILVLVIWFYPHDRPADMPHVPVRPAASSAALSQDEGQIVGFNEGHAPIEGPQPFVGADHDQIYTQSDGFPRYSGDGENSDIVLPSAWVTTRPSTRPKP